MRLSQLNLVRLVTVFGVVGFASTLGYGGAVAAPAPPPCVATATPNPGTVGSSMTLTATGFAGNEGLDIFKAQNGGAAANGPSTADSSGDWTTTFTPSSGVAGSWVFNFTGTTSGVTCTLNFTVRLTTPTTTTVAPTTTVSPTTVTTATAAAAAHAVSGTPAFTG
jgi:hypothetical protein